MSNNIFIDLTEELVNKGWTVHWEFNSDIIDPLKYNHCTTYTECRTVNANVATDVEDGAWNYRLDNLETGGVFDEEAEIFDGLFFTDGGNTHNTSLVSFNVDLPNLTDGSFMFSGCMGLTSWNIPLPKLTDGSYMFSACNFNSFSSDLPNLTNGYQMFGICLELTSFSSALPNLTIGCQMFNMCMSLTSWNIPLPKLTIGNEMFSWCTSLTSFTSDLSSLTNGDSMFGLTSYSCTKLDLASVQNIAETINDLTGKTNDGTEGWGQISIGISSSIQGNADLETALAAIVAKGWTVSEMYK